MQYEFTRRRGARSPVTDARTFRVGKLAKMTSPAETRIDITHLIDRSYDYHSHRELRWHLAERLGIQAQSLVLHEYARGR